MIFLVTIEDKDLAGEPDIALGVVEAPYETEALRHADASLAELAAQGRCRCVAHARPIELGRFYRFTALVRPSASDRTFDAQGLRDELAAAKRRCGQRARWEPDDPGAPPDTCRYCGRRWMRWAGSRLDGHAACLVDAAFQVKLRELFRHAPRLTYTEVATELGVSTAVIRAWCSPSRQGRTA